MARYRFTMQRLFVDDPLEKGGVLGLDRNQSNYLVAVLRMKQGDEVLVFNGRDGEYLAALENASKKNSTLLLKEQTREQSAHNDLIYCFAPLKHARLDYMVQKATEMGVSVLQPVITRHTQTSKFNVERARANVIEAAEQCGVLAVPSVEEPVSLDALIASWTMDRTLVFCDEGNLGDDPYTVLQPLKNKPLSVLIGPEGGFSEEERTLLNGQPFVRSIPLGPRILRADPAAVAALALIQAACGDWV